MKAIYFKYLAANKSDIDWGLFIRVAGFTENPPNAPYPMAQHPSGYHFSWDKGRILDEYQLSYITKGQGVLETDGKTFEINSGTVFLIRPGQWHRYKPDNSTGWDEYYIGFDGVYASNVFSQPFFQGGQSAFDVGHNITMLNSFKEIIEKVESEHPGCQQQAAGRVMNILGEIVAVVKNREFYGKDIEKRIRKAQFDLRERLDRNINFEEFSERYEMSYSYFRQKFKTYTGLSPAQYHLQLRLQKARELISSTNETVKQIAFELGFESQFHFSKMYKKKFGFPPAQTGKQVI